MLNFDYNETQNILTCTFSGRLDTNVSLELCDIMCGKIKTLKGTDDPESLFEGRIVFNMAGVDYISSSFIRICINAAKQVQKGNFSIVNCDPFVKKTFKVAGLDDLLNIR